MSGMVTICAFFQPRKGNRIRLTVATVMLDQRVDGVVGLRPVVAGDVLHHRVSVSDSRKGRAD